MLKYCPEHDRLVIRKNAALLLGSCAIQATTLSLVGHKLFAAPGEISPAIVTGSLLIAGQIQALDGYAFFLGSYHLSGIAALLRGGLDIGGGPGPRARAASFAVRLLLSFGLAQLMALFMGLVIYSSEINDHILADNRRANAQIVAKATTAVDGEIQAANDAVKTQSNRVEYLSKQTSILREHDIDPAGNAPEFQQAQQEINRLAEEKSKADDAVVTAQNFEAMELGGLKIAPQNSGIPGDGSRHKAALMAVENAKKHAAEIASALGAERARLDGLRKELGLANDAEKRRAHAELPAFEASLATEEERLAKFKLKVDNLDSGRADNIRRAVEHAADYVPLKQGFLAQLKAFKAIGREDGTIGTVMFLVDLVFMLLELGAVTVKAASYIPTDYSLLIAHRAFLNEVIAADDIEAALNKAPANENKSPAKSDTAPANDNKRGGTTPTASGAPVPPNPPPKRKRGRPRKTPLH
jgi:hypothetical protein